jgi:KEOPS complex subunit Pcc1
MKARAVIRLKFPSEEHAKIVLRALEPETKTMPTTRSGVKIEGDGKSLTIRFEARDTSALRASINSYLRWISLINSVRSVLESPSRNYFRR